MWQLSKVGMPMSLLAHKDQRQYQQIQELSPTAINIQTVPVWRSKKQGFSSTLAK